MSSSVIFATLAFLKHTLFNFIAICWQIEHYKMPSCCQLFGEACCYPIPEGGGDKGGVNAKV